MDKRIIYPSDGAGVAIIIPASNVYTDGNGVFITPRSDEVPPDGFHKATIEEIAAKDVPAGKPFEIIDAADLPDRQSRNAWEWE